MPNVCLALFVHCELYNPKSRFKSYLGEWFVDNNSSLFNSKEAKLTQKIKLVVNFKIFAWNFEIKVFVLVDIGKSYFQVR